MLRSTFLNDDNNNNNDNYYDKPDIIIKDHINNTCQFIDMTTPPDKNVAIKEAE